MWFAGRGDIYQIHALVKVSLTLKLKKAQQRYLPGDMHIEKFFNLHSLPVQLCSYLMTVKQALVMQTVSFY